MYLATQPVRARGTYYLGSPLSRRLYRPRLNYLGQPINTSGQAAVNASGQAGQVVNAGGVPIYVPGTRECAGAQSVGKALITSAATTGGGLLLKIGVSSANPILLAAGGAAELAGVVFGAIFGHHAAAVRREQSILCAAVPAANDSLNVIDQAVQQGQFTAQQGITALDNLVSGFQSAVQPILKMDQSHCNAACVMIMALKAAVATRKQAYTNLASQQAAAAAQEAAHPVATALAPVTSVFQSAESAVASAGLPKWLLPAAAFVLLYELV